VLDKVHDDPTKGTGRGGGVGVEGGIHGADGAIERRTAVEAKPAEPDETSAEEDEGRVVRLVVHGVLALLDALAEDQGVCQCRPARGDVHGATAGIVERREFVEPSVGVPGPAGYGAVDYGAPEEAEQKRWDDAPTLKGTSNDDLNRAGGK